MVMVFAPTFKFTGAEAVPDVTAVPLTFTVAFGSEVLGVTVIEVTELAIATV